MMGEKVPQNMHLVEYLWINSYRVAIFPQGQGILKVDREQLNSGKCVRNWQTLFPFLDLYIFCKVEYNETPAIKPLSFSGKPLKVFPYRASVGIVVSVIAILCSFPTLSQCYTIFLHVRRLQQTVKLWRWLCWFRGNR